MIDVALFGAGRIGRIHADNLARTPGLRLRHVVDAQPEPARELAERHGAGVVDADTALGDASIRAVLIASSTDTHADLIERAAAAGKAIFCEKPIDLALDRARACAQAVRRAGVAALIGFQRRYDPTFQALHARCAAGEIGTPQILLITSRDPAPPPIDYVRRSGGIFKDMLIHDLDLFRWLLDDPAQSVHASGSCLIDPRIAQADDADSVAVTIRTERGRLCQINATRRAAYGYDQRVELLGSAGMLQAGNLRPTEVVLHSATAQCRDLPEPFFLERYRAAYAAEMQHFADVVRAGVAPRTTLEDGVQALALAEAATRSWREGRPVAPV